MRTIEQQGRAWRELLKQAEKEPMILYFRGVNAKDAPLYEITTKKGAVICLQGTERQVMEWLTNQPETK